MTSPNPVSPDHTGSRLELGIFLASFAVLFLELLLTRIFSVTMFHHFAFFAVALAMTGLGAGGLALTVLPERFPRERLPVLAGVSALVFALATVLVVSLAFHLPVTRGLRAVAGISARMVSWSWAVNAAASVFGSVCAVLVSMTAGFGAAMLVGIGAYAVALLAARMAS